MNLREVEARLGGMHELREIVGAMRALAAGRLRQAESGREGAVRYASIVGGAYARAASCFRDGLPAAPEVPQRRLIAVLGSEHGFVGGLNRRLYEAVGPADGGTSVVVVGSRLARTFEDEHRPIAAHLPMATHVGAVDVAAARLADTLIRVADGTARAADTIEMVYPSARGRAGVEITRETLRPLDPPPLSERDAHNPPLHYLSERLLLDEIVEEFALARIASAIVETMVGVNRSRLLCVQSAYDNIGRRLDDLERFAHRIRQEEITREVLDVASGAEAAKSDSRASS